MNKAKEKITEAWNENPMLVIAVGTAATAALTKLIGVLGDVAVKSIEARAGVESKRAYAKQINTKSKQS